MPSPYKSLEVRYHEERYRSLREQYLEKHGQAPEWYDWSQENTMVERAGAYVPFVFPVRCMAAILHDSLVLFNRRRTLGGAPTPAQYATEDDNEEFLDRIMRNYIRHHLTDWPEAVREFDDYPDALAEARKIIDKTVDNYIEEACKLSDETFYEQKRQKRNDLTTKKG